MSIIEFALSTLKELGDVLGILQKVQGHSLDDEIEELIERRQQARKEKLAEADSIRDELKERGIILEDTPGCEVEKSLSIKGWGNRIRYYIAEEVFSYVVERI